LNFYSYIPANWPVLSSDVIALTDEELHPDFELY
jgi:hypothetical protein